MINSSTSEYDVNCTLKKYLFNKIKNAKYCVNHKYCSSKTLSIKLYNYNRDRLTRVKCIPVSFRRKYGTEWFPLVALIKVSHLQKNLDFFLSLTVNMLCKHTGFKCVFCKWFCKYNPIFLHYRYVLKNLAFESEFYFTSDQN